MDLEVIVHCVEGVTNKFADIDRHLRRPGEYSEHCTSPLIPIRHSQINAASLRLTLTIPKQYKGPFKTPDPPRDFLSVSQRTGDRMDSWIDLIQRTILLETGTQPGITAATN
jgi:hypothetical protein